MAKRKTKCKYMHLLNGEPAYFDGEMICFARHGVPAARLIVDSLDEIRAQQRASREYREAMDFDIHEYSYLRVNP